MKNKLFSIRKHLVKEGMRNAECSIIDLLDILQLINPMVQSVDIARHTMEKLNMDPFWKIYLHFTDGDLIGFNSFEELEGWTTHRQLLHRKFTPVTINKEAQ